MLKTLSSPVSFRSRFLRSSLAFAACSFAAFACVADTQSGDVTDDDLSSLTARSRTLQFQGKVYVNPGLSDDSIVYSIKSQTKTAFGALLHAEIAVNNRELSTIDKSTFVKRDVIVVDTSLPNDPGVPMTEVTYTYKDNAVVPVSYARKTSLSLAVLAAGGLANTSKVIEQCTENSEHSREYPVWYEFDPKRGTCKTVISEEQRAVDDARKMVQSLTSNKVPKLEMNRMYLPITVKLGADKTNKGKSYPEYQRLYSGGVQKDKLVLGLLYGFIDDDSASNPSKDYNWGEWMTNLKLMFAARPGFKLVKSEPALDLKNLTLSTGKVVPEVTVEQAMNWTEYGSGVYPAGFTSSEKTELRTLVSKKLLNTYLTFEAPVQVQIGSDAPKDFGIQIFTRFGGESSTSTYKQFVKNSDVFTYNGHSYLGGGPLSPSNFTASDFPETYQILWIDGCVSYNYYEKDYFPLKKDGTKNLDLITNGMEAPSYQSGSAMGKLMARLIDGTFPSYLELLKAASATDPLRVVDGEVDNVYSPEKTKVIFK